MTARLWQYCLRHPWLAVAVAAAFYAIPLIFYISPSLDDNDLLFYKVVLTQFSLQFWQGDIYPRWLNSANDGIGSPVMLFLGAGAYYPTVLLQFLQGVDPDGSLRFALSVLAARLLAGWACYRWLIGRTDKAQALLVTLLFLTLPYEIHTIYVRKELAEQWSFPFMFFALHAFDALISGHISRKSWLILSLCFAALIFIHLPSFVAFAVVPYGYGMFMSKAGSRLRAMWFILSAMITSVLLTAFYWLPLILNLPYINAGYYYSSKYSYINNFLIHPNELLCLPYFLLAVLTLYLAKRQGGMDPLLKFHLILVAAIAFMVLPISIWVWHVVVPYHFLQFPYRFLNIGLLAFAYIAAWLARRGLKPLLLGIWMAFLLMHSYVIFTYAPHADPAILRKIPDHNMIMLSEYLTRWQKNPDEIQKKVLSNVYKQQAEFTATLGTVEVLKTIPGYSKDVLVTSNSGTDVVYKNLYFANYEVINTDSQMQLPVEQTQDGLIKVHLPAGRHFISFNPKTFRGQYEGYLITLGTLIFLALLFILNRRESQIA